jgi:hypothetical protein
MWNRREQILCMSEGWENEANILGMGFFMTTIMSNRGHTVDVGIFAGNEINDYYLIGIIYPPISK